jgi:hypothetical protein
MALYAAGVLMGYWLGVTFPSHLFGSVLSTAVCLVVTWCVYRRNRPAR